MGNAGTTPSYLFNHAFPLTSAESRFIDIDNAIKAASWGFYLADDELFSSHQVSKRRVWLDLEKEAIDFAQHVLGLRALFCEVLEENKAVIKLHERSGFEEITHTHTHTPGVRRLVLQFCQTKTHG